MNTKILCIGLLAAALSIFATPMAAHAQEDPGGLISVRIIQVKAGRTREFIELQRQHVAARIVAGMEGRGVWRVAHGNINTFQVVTFADNFAHLDEQNEPPMNAGDWARWVNRVTDVIQSTEFVTLRMHPDLAIPAAEGIVPNLLVLRYRTVSQGQNTRYHEWMKDKLVPGLRNGGVTGFSAQQVVSGENPNMWVTASQIDSWAEMDGPGPFAELSDRQRGNLFEDGNAMVKDARNEVLRYLADLSD
jgi:hypothetical protein